MGVPSGLEGAGRAVELLRARLEKEHSCPAGAPAFVRDAFSDYTPEERPQALEWMSYAQSAVGSSAKLDVLDVYLASKSVLVGYGTRITVADLGVFVSVRESVAALSVEDRDKLLNLVRWFDYIQHKDDVRQVYGLVPISTSSFCPPNLSILDPNKAAIKEQQDVPAASQNKRPENAADKLAGAQSAQEPSKEQPAVVPKKASEKKEKPPAQKKEVDCDVSVLDICVGQIKKVWKHPSADSLYVEEIDVGEAEPRQIVSGLVKYVTEEEMLNRRVLVLLNVKAGKVRDVLSSGLVLCASNEDHTMCEPVAPPEEAPVGSRVKFEGHNGKPEDVLNPKKKQWEKIAPDLRTDAQGVANYQGKPFQTVGGFCKSRIANGNIK